MIGLLLGTVTLPHAAAQQPNDPFVRGAPVPSVPGLAPLPTAAQPADAAQPQSAPVRPALPLLGPARASSQGEQTRVVYDLPAGVSYTLTAISSGLRLNFSGVRATPGVSLPLGVSVGEARVSSQPGGAQIELSTPFPLSGDIGWRASETTIASGGRVLILEFGPAIIGGANPAGRGGQVAASPSVPNPNPSPNAGNPAPAAPEPTAPLIDNTANVMDNTAALTPTPVTPQQPVPDDQLAPGDNTAPQTGSALPAPAAELPGVMAGDPNVLSGQVAGTVQPGSLLAPPRIGKNPGVTRIVLDLPPGSRFQISPGALGLNIALSGVGAINQNVVSVSSELRGWRYAPDSAASDQLSVFLLSASPLSVHSGWRSVLLPPAPGSDRARLAIDFSPAFANPLPVTPDEAKLAPVPPVRSSALAFSGSAAMVAPSVVIDPGHGGRDPGAVGVVTEKAVVLDVALRVRRYLQAAGVNVIMTREGDTALSADKATDLNARAALGYNGAQLFLSIHANSMEPANVLRGYGIETWWNKNNPASSAFATLLQQNVILTSGAYNQGLKNSRSLAVLRGSKVPAALIEIGFVGHPIDGGNLQDTNYLDRVALGIAKGIREALVGGVGVK